MAKKWKPTDEQILRIQRLAEMGTPIGIIAGEMGQWAVDYIDEFKKIPAVKQALKTGTQIFKDPHRGSQYGWWPKPEELPVITGYFARSLGYKEVACLLGTTERVLRNRAREIPQLAEAIERGEAMRNNELADIAWNIATNEQAMSKNPGLLIFMLKQHLGWSDRQQIEVKGNVTVTAQLAPVKKVSADKTSAMVSRELKAIGRKSEGKPSIVLADEPEENIIDVTPQPVPTLAKPSPHA